MKARAISEVERVVRNTLARPVDSNTVELRAVCKAKCVVVRIWTVSADALSSVAVSIELSDPDSRVATRRVRDPPHSNLAEPAQGADCGSPTPHDPKPCCEAAVEPRPAEPVDRSVTRDERRAPAVPDDRVVIDRSHETVRWLASLLDDRKSRSTSQAPAPRGRDRNRAGRRRSSRRRGADCR